jgi:hypothetical protein
MVVRTFLSLVWRFTDIPPSLHFSLDAKPLWWGRELGAAGVQDPLWLARDKNFKSGEETDFIGWPFWIP